MNVRVTTLPSLALLCVLACSASRDERLDGDCITDSDCGSGGQCVAARCGMPTGDVAGPRVAVRGEARGTTAQVDARSSAEGAGCADQQCSLPPGAAATLIAPEVPGFRFAGWSGHPRCSGVARELVLADVREDLACTADYVPRAAVVGVSDGAPAAIVARADSGFASCSEGRCEVDVGQSVSLLAPSVQGYRLRGWSGEGCSDEGGASASARDVSGSRTCVAHYVAGVSVSGSVIDAEGEVIASSESAGASCQRGSCAIDAGGVVTLQAPTLEARTFLGWSGDAACSGTERTLVLREVSSSKTCRAAFARRLRISGGVTPAGSGSVVASANGPTARCAGPSCEVDLGQDVALTAVEAERYRFTGWSGGEGCMGTQLRLGLRAPQTSLGCTANFARRPYTVSLSTRGGGTAQASVAGVACPNNVCSVPPGGSVALRVGTSGEEFFENFSGCRPGAATSAAGTTSATLSGIEQNQACIAHVVKRAIVRFDPGTGGCGMVRASVAPASAASACTADLCRVRQGSTLTLRAEPGPRCTFTRWRCAGGITPTIEGDTVQLVGVRDVPEVRCSAEFFVVVI